MEPQQILRFLRRRGWRVVCWGIGFAVIVGAASHYLQTPVYESGALVLLQPNGQSLTQQTPNQVDAASFAASQIIVIRSLVVATAAAATIPGNPAPGLLMSKSRVSGSPTSSVLAIIAESEDPAQAQQMANALAKAYVENRYAFAVGNLRAVVKDLEPQLKALQAEIAALDARIANAAPPGAPAQSTSALQATRDATLSQYQALYAKQQDLKVDAQLTRGPAEIVSAAALPGAPVSPEPRRDAALGLLAGLLFGLGIELLREKFGDKVNSAEELEEITARPVLAEIPSDDAVAGVSPAVLRPGEFPESIRTLRTSLQFLAVEHPLRRIVVSSAGPGDGKTTVAANLAVAYAEAGFATVLVSGDLRRPQVETLFGPSQPGLGLSTLLAGDTMRPRFPQNGHKNGDQTHAASDDASQSRSVRIGEFLRLLAVNPGIPNLTVIPGGPVPPNPAELLGSTRMREVLDVLGAQADVIIIDTPPALVVTDSVVLSDASDGVLIVASAEKSTRRDVKRLMAMYETADVPVLGAVLNRAPRTRGKSAYYDAYYTTPKRDRAKR